MGYYLLSGYNRGRPEKPYKQVCDMGYVLVLRGKTYVKNSKWAKLADQIECAAHWLRRAAEGSEYAADQLRKMCDQVSYEGLVLKFKLEELFAELEAASEQDEAK